MNETVAAILRENLKYIEGEIQRAEEMHDRDLKIVREGGRKVLSLENQRHDILLALGNWAIVPGAPPICGGAPA